MLRMRLAGTEDIPSVVGLLKACVAALRTAGIDQWDEVYPTEEAIQSDVAWAPERVSAWAPMRLRAQARMCPCAQVPTRPCAYAPWRRTCLHRDMPLPHHSLVVWQRADDLFIRLHRLSQRLPATEHYELGSQLRRSAFSVPVNIVEGLARKGPAEKRRFLRIARASLAEVGYCLHAARRLNYISEADYPELELDVRKVSAPLRGLIRSLGRKNPK